MVGFIFEDSFRSLKQKVQLELSFFIVKTVRNWLIKSCKLKTFSLFDKSTFIANFLQ